MTTLEVTIGPLHGPADPPHIAISFKQGTKSLRVELSASDFALAVTGRMVRGTVTRDTLTQPPARPKPLDNSAGTLDSPPGARGT